MLATAVDAGERLLMEKHLEIRYKPSSFRTQGFGSRTYLNPSFLGLFIVISL